MEWGMMGLNLEVGELRSRARCFGKTWISPSSTIHQHTASYKNNKKGKSKAIHSARSPSVESLII